MPAATRHPDLAALGETVTTNPTHVWIEPTNRCNTRCTHCGHFYDKFGQDMGEELYAKVAASALDRVERVELIGYGEPLMARGYHTMFDDLAARGIEIFTTSNGILLRNDELVAKLVRANFVLCLSIDGARAETLEFVRPYIKWAKMIETLECIKRVADAAGAERRFKFRFNFVAMKQNIGDLPDLVRLAHTYGAEEIFILPLGGEEVFEKVRGQSLHDSPELVSPAFMKALPLATRLGVTVTVPTSFRPLIVAGAERRRGIKGRVRAAGRMLRLGANLLQRDGVGRLVRRLTSGPGPRAKAGVSYCIMPWQDSYFASDGTVFPCCIMGEKLGDLTRQSWDEVWNGQQYRNLRRTVHSWNPTMVCRTCPLPTGINGGNELQYADFFGKFRAEAVALDAPEVRLEEGFFEIERAADGAASHAWMPRRGVVTLPMRRGAKFVRVRLVARSPVHEPNPGTCTIDGMSPEPFDNSCDQVNFPLRGATLTADGRVRLTLAMENEHHVGEDARALSLGVRGFEFLF